MLITFNLPIIECSKINFISDFNIKFILPGYNMPPEDWVYYGYYCFYYAKTNNSTIL